MVKDVKAREANQDIMLNLLTSTEQKAYVELEHVAIGLIMANLEYKFIKEMLEKIAIATKNCPKVWQSTTAKKIFSMNSRANVFSDSYFNKNKRNLQ
ncbi:hypothetical protein SAMN05216438_101543 [Lactococcus garvieae]|uniref:Uncharacterized protein n=2 Tax=Lactococcus garvieae TaxID=1363 RepID=A0A1I4FAM3_9LACT|nr:hypothetical protein SAMN05216438_101543 [Lactococcus garvieae]